MNNQRLARRVLLVFGVLLALWAVWYFWLSLKTVTIRFENIQSVAIYSTAALDAGKDPRPVKTVKDSGQSVRLRGGSYTLHYMGEAGYDSRYQEFSVTKNGQTIKITAEYSEAKQAELAAEEAPAVLAALQAKYPKLGDYTVQPGRLYREGTWYGTTLKYKGADYFNFDTLRVVLHKADGEWVVKTDPPAISLSKHFYPDVPVDVLRAINEL